MRPFKASQRLPHVIQAVRNTKVREQKGFAIDGTFSAARKARGRSSLTFQLPVFLVSAIRPIDLPQHHQLSKNACVCVEVWLHTVYCW